MMIIFLLMIESNKIWWIRRRWSMPDSTSSLCLPFPSYHRIYPLSVPINLMQSQMTSQYHSDCVYPFWLYHWVHTFQFLTFRLGCSTSLPNHCSFPPSLDLPSLRLWFGYVGFLISMDMSVLTKSKYDVAWIQDTVSWTCLVFSSTTLTEAVWKKNCKLTSKCKLDSCAKSSFYKIYLKKLAHHRFALEKNASSIKQSNPLQQQQSVHQSNTTINDQVFI